MDISDSNKAALFIETENPKLMNSTVLGARASDSKPQSIVKPGPGSSTPGESTSDRTSPHIA